MITTINEFKKFLLKENVVPNDAINSEKAIKLKEYQDDLDYFNTNKDKFKSILISKDETQWEQEANKIINGNIYLANMWKFHKLENDVKLLNDKLSQDITEDEKREASKQMGEIRKQSTDIKKELDKKIKEDLIQIQQL